MVILEGKQFGKFEHIFFPKIICTNQHWVIFLVCEVKQKFAKLPPKKKLSIEDQFPSLIHFILSYVV
jgi:hypothetical protein